MSDERSKKATGRPGVLPHSGKASKSHEDATRQVHKKDVEGFGKRPKAANAPSPAAAAIGSSLPSSSSKPFVSGDAKPQSSPTAAPAICTAPWRPHVDKSHPDLSSLLFDPTPIAGQTVILSKPGFVKDQDEVHENVKIRDLATYAEKREPNLLVESPKEDGYSKTSSKPAEVKLSADKKIGETRSRGGNGGWQPEPSQNAKYSYNISNSKQYDYAYKGFSGDSGKVGAFTAGATVTPVYGGVVSQGATNELVAGAESRAARACWTWRASRARIRQ